MNHAIGKLLTDVVCTAGKAAVEHWVNGKSSIADTDQEVSAWGRRMGPSMGLYSCHATAVMLDRHDVSDCSLDDFLSSVTDVFNCMCGTASVAMSQLFGVTGEAEVISNGLYGNPEAQGQLRAFAERLLDDLKHGRFDPENEYDE